MSKKHTKKKRKENTKRTQQNEYIPTKEELKKVKEYYENKKKS